MPPPASVRAMNSWLPFKRTVLIWKGAPILLSLGMMQTAKRELPNETDFSGCSRSGHKSLGLLTQRPGHAGGDICKSWATDLNRFGCLFFVPEIADYELRRELLRHGNTAAVSRLEVLNAAVSGAYLPLTTAEVRFAAGPWAQVRNSGKTTAPPDALDGDALIAAQAALLDPSAFTSQEWLSRQRMPGIFPC